MASINNVVTATLLPEGKAAAKDNMNVCAIITSGQGVLSTAERYRVYLAASEVASDFGASSIESSFANTFFSTTPNPSNAGGALVMGYWRSVEESVAATSATLISEQLSEAEITPLLNGITDGSFKVTVDSTDKEVTGIDGTTFSSLSDLVTAVSKKLTKSTMTESNGYLTIKSKTTGATSTMTYAEPASSGTDISTLLKLNSASAANLTQGKAESKLAAETKVDAITAIKASVNIKGATFIDNVLDAEVQTLASWATANQCIIYDVFDKGYIDKSASNPVWKVATSNQSAYRCLLSESGNQQLAVSYMARCHVVNFSAENSALTMNLKELSVPTENYSETDIKKAYDVGLDLYTLIKDVPVVLTSPKNDYVDNVYNLYSFVDAVQTNAFNLLKTTPTKVAQTDQGVMLIEDNVEKTCSQYVRAGVFASGTWTLPDTFGDRAQFLTGIKNNGYYVLAGDLADQSVSDRQQRKSPVIQVAVKNAGAIHKSDIIINFNK